MNIIDTMKADIVCACRSLCVTLYRINDYAVFTLYNPLYDRLHRVCALLYVAAQCIYVIRCCCCLQTINSCSPCSLSSLTSTSVRVTWPKNWFRVPTEYYTVICTSTPSCGTTRVRRLTFSTVVTGLRAGTYYQFRVTNDRARDARRPVHRTCAGTTSLYQSDLYIV